VEVVVSLDVVDVLVDVVDRVVVVRDVVVDDSVVDFVVEVPGGLEGGVLPPQPCAFPLLPLLPQLPLLGFSPLPGLSSPVCGSFSVLAFDPLGPSGSLFGTLPCTSPVCVSGGRSADVEGSAIANAPPRPHRNSPMVTKQADAAPCTREPTSSPPFKASAVAYSQDPSIFAQPGQTVRCGDECTREVDTSKPPTIRTITLGCTTAALS
jgi:hypothetical protein